MRMLALYIAVAFLMMTLNTSLATAQVEIGPYQQKILDSMSEGAEIGANAGKQGGPVGVVVGGAFGAIIGGAYADHKHASEKVHDFRKKFVVHLSNHSAQAITYRSYSLSKNSWVEVEMPLKSATLFNSSPVRIVYKSADRGEVAMVTNGGVYQFRDHGKGIELFKVK